MKDIFKKRENQVMLGIIILSIVLIIFGFYLLNKNGDGGLAPRKIPSSDEEIIWKEYQNKKYSFKVEYPEHFRVYEDGNLGGPAINFYFQNEESDLPLSYTSNESQISIFPLGISSGGANLTFEVGEWTNGNGLVFETKDFKTFEGELWGRMLIPKETSEKWNSFGFIWIGSRIKDLNYRCFDGETEKDVSICNVFEGDQIFKDGEIDKEFLQVGEEFLNRIEF
jgi:hypothetical protein